jgi:MFS family permease
MCAPKLIWILFCTFVSNMAYAVIAPFLPGEFEKKQVSLEWTGFIFAIYSLAVVLWSPIVASKLYVDWNPVTVITCGMISMGCTFIVFGFTDYIVPPTWIIVASLTLRFCQGMSSATI